MYIVTTRNIKITPLPVTIYSTKSNKQTRKTQNNRIFESNIYQLFNPKTKSTKSHVILQNTDGLLHIKIHIKTPLYFKYI